MNPSEKILKKIAEHLTLNPEDLDRHAMLREDLNLGPLELNDLLNDLSDEFDIVLKNEDVEKLETVEDLVVLIEDNMIG
jgi:acyl carrier protein